MHVQLSAEMEQQLSRSAARQGCRPEEIVGDILAGYLADETRLLDEVNSWSGEDRDRISAHIQEGYLQATQGRVTPAHEARAQIQAMKDAWLRERSLQP